MIVSFFTPKYAEEAAGLRASLDKFGYAHEIVAVEEQGNWEANCALKASIVRQALQKHEQVLFLDADARVKGSIDELLQPHDGIKLHKVTNDQFKPGWQAQKYRYHAVKHSMWNSGILSVRRSPESLALMDAWVEMAERRPGQWDQLCLQWAHIESGSNVPVHDLPFHLRAGKGPIGHKSAFHKYWRKVRTHRVIRKILLLGSAGYLPEWWRENREAYLDQGFQIVAMNNACEVIGDDCHLWVIPNDYTGKHRAGDSIPSNANRYPRATNRAGNWIHRPYWLKHPTTILFSALAHVLNEAILDRCFIEVHVAGSDMIYKPGKSHFYGQGTADPLRYSDSELVKGQEKVMAWYQAHGCKVFNSGGQEETRLIFPKT